MCPECNEPLLVYELDGIEVDRCAACGGTWLDAGELELIAERAGAEPGRLTEALRAAKPQGKSARRCPRCHARMQTVGVGEAATVEIERCPREHGLWFDRGEMRTVVVAFGEGEEGAVAQFFSSLYQHEIQSDSRGE